MTNNDVLRKLRYIEQWGDQDVIDLCALVNFTVNREIVCNWLKRDDDPEYLWISDLELADVLNALIIDKRGSNGTPIPKAEAQLSNNAILRKLRIAYTLTDDGIVEILQKASMRFSKSEVNALFRVEGHPKYVICQDQLLRKFLQGLEMTIRE